MVFRYRKGLVHALPRQIRDGAKQRPVQVDHATIPTAVFSQPEVGTVGLTEQEARAQFSHVDIYKTDFRPIKATMSGRDTRVLMKLVVDGASDRVLGCHIVGDAAAEITQAVQAGDPAAQVQVDLGAGEVRVASRLDLDQLLAAIREEGYAAEPA